MAMRAEACFFENFECFFPESDLTRLSYGRNSALDWGHRSMLRKKRPTGVGSRFSPSHFAVKDPDSPQEPFPTCSDKNQSVCYRYEQGGRKVAVVWLGNRSEGRHRKSIPPFQGFMKQQFDQESATKTRRSRRGNPSHGIDRNQKEPEWNGKE